MIAIQKRKAFTQLLYSSKPLILIGIHDALSAKLAEKAGFKALWSSSFGFSTTSGFPDANLLTLSENLAMITKINHQSKLPLIADCDSGYGDLVIFNRVVREFKSAGVTGICIEDNVFPKRCSFYGKGIHRELVPINEHAAKIRLAKYVRKDKNFFIIARTEAFIAGQGLREALKRATVYAKAGADAICVHSKRTDPKEVMEFAHHWKNSIPLVAIPTTYYNVPPQNLFEVGYKIIIYANQMIRSSIKSMEEVLKSMKKEKERIKIFTQGLSTLDEVFDITDVNHIQKNTIYEIFFIPTI